MKKTTDIISFEKGFACRWLAFHAYSFWKGRVAMYAILRALGVGPEDEVIVPGYTCVMDINPIKYLGAKAVYIDIEPKMYNMDPELLEGKITEKTKVIVAQHTYGYPCEMDAIMEIADRRGITVVEDCCLACGSMYKGRKTGVFGRAAYFSFQWNKPFTTGLGGMAIGRDDEFKEKMDALCEQELKMPSFKMSFMLALQRIVYGLVIYPRTTALITNVFRSLIKKGLVVGSSSTCEFEPTMPDDFFMGMGQSQASCGIARLRTLEKNMRHRREMKKVYDHLLAEAGFDVIEVPDYMDPVLVRYPVRIKDKEKALVEAVKAGVEIGSWFECPLHPIETPMAMYGYEDGMCPVAEQACREVVNLPVHPRTNEKMARRTVEFIRSFRG